MRSCGPRWRAIDVGCSYRKQARGSAYHPGAHSQCGPATRQEAGEASSLCAAPRQQGNELVCFVEMRAWSLVCIAVAHCGMCLCDYV